MALPVLIMLQMWWMVTLVISSYNYGLLFSLWRPGYAPETLRQILGQTPAALELREVPLDVGVAVPRRRRPRRHSLAVGRLGPAPPRPFAQRPHSVEVATAGRQPQRRRTVVAAVITC